MKKNYFTTDINNATDLHKKFIWTGSKNFDTRVLYQLFDCTRINTLVSQETKKLCKKKKNEPEELFKLRTAKIRESINREYEEDCEDIYNLGNRYGFFCVADKRPKEAPTWIATGHYFFAYKAILKVERRGYIESEDIIVFVKR